MKDTIETDFAGIDSDYDGRTDGQEVLSDGTNPLDGTSAVFGRLAYFPFNDTNWLGSAGQSPMAASNAVSQDAWVSKGLSINTASGAFLKYRDLESDLSANINLRQGALRFWFKSVWDTGGTNPASLARLIEVGTKGDGTTNGWWALYFSQTNGTVLTFAAETNNAGATYLTGAVSWAKCDWNQLVLNYTPTNSALYLNSSLVATGLGVTLWPGATVRANGFTVGSDGNGANQARGLFEDLETFNYPLTTNEIVENFQTNRPPNAIADLKMWLKGDAGIFAPVGAYVQSWFDQACNTADAIQLTDPRKPWYSTNELNGRPVIRFDTNTYFNLQVFPTNWTEAEAFVILKTETDSGSPNVHRGLWKIETSGSGARYPQDDGVVSDNFGRSSTGNPSGRPSLSISQPHLYNVTTKAGEWTSRLNGVMHYSTSDNAVGFPASGLQLGINRFSEYFQGYIAEVLFYNRVLTETERKRVEIYLNQRYALVTNVPPTPTNLVAHAVSPTQTSLSWDAVLDNTNVIFTVERKTGGGAFSTVAELRNGASYLDSGLQTNTAYTYRVKANNWAGPSGYSFEASVTTSTNGADIPLSALKLWLKADCGRGANPLCFWADQSGNGGHASQNNKDRRGIAVENAIATNKPVIGFFNTNSFFLRSLGNNTWTNAETYVVLKTSQTNAVRELWLFGSAGGTWYPSTDGRIWDNFFRELNANSTLQFPLVSLQAFHLYNPVSTSNSWSSRINGALYVSTNNSYQNHSQPTLGIAGNSIPWEGEMAEFLIFNQVLTSGERAAVENYLNGRHFLW